MECPHKFGRRAFFSPLPKGRGEKEANDCILTMGPPMNPNPDSQAVPTPPFNAAPVAPTPSAIPDERPPNSEGIVLEAVAANASEPSSNDWLTGSAIPTLPACATRTLWIDCPRRARCLPQALGRRNCLAPKHPGQSVSVEEVRPITDGPIELQLLPRRVAYRTRSTAMCKRKGVPLDSPSTCSESWRSETHASAGCAVGEQDGWGWLRNRSFAAGFPQPAVQIGVWSSG